MIVIGSVEFKTKKDAVQYIREIINRNGLNQPLEGSDFTFVKDLLLCHPEADSKIGVGVSSIVIEQEHVFNKTRHFSVVRTDGSSTDFSFNKCLSPNLNDPIKLFKLAARRVVEDQIITFRDNSYAQAGSTGKVPCQITGVMVGKNGSHVDHVPPNTFEKIIQDFMCLYRVDVNRAKFVESTTGIGKIFADQKLKDDFAEYHRINARLRIVSRSANLRQKKK